MLEMERYLIGKQPFPHGKVWNFKCPVCKNTYRGDQPGEPLCTGPSNTLDEHEPTVMLVQSVVPIDRNEVNAPPDLAIVRAEGTLYIPGHGFADNREDA